MGATGKWYAAAIATVLLLIFASARYGNAQFEGLEGMDPPDDVSGVDCAMCHGDFAQQFSFEHEPAFDGDCITCHMTTGDGTHGGLTDEGRGLCIECHGEQEYHYPALTCWASSCHSDTHGSDVNELLNPSLSEEYPGFTEATLGANFVGSDSCLGCHTEVCSNWAKSMHALSDLNENLPPVRKGCESCHGAGGDHWGRPAGIGNFAMATVEEADARCLTCHRDEIYASDYEKTMHPLAGVACISCHDPHNLDNKHNLKMEPNTLCLDCHKTKRDDFARLSHHPVDMADPRTGMQCTECHNPHGAEGDFMLSAPTGELCISCHADKAGPFVYAHPGYDPALGEGCMTCHAAHGANAPNLLVMSGRGLCLQCHTEQVNHFAGQTCWTSGCHSEHHGSNENFFFFNN